MMSFIRPRLAFAIARFFDITVDKMFDPADEEAGT